LHGEEESEHGEETGEEDPLPPNMRFRQKVIPPSYMLRLTDTIP